MPVPARISRAGAVLALAVTTTMTAALLSTLPAEARLPHIDPALLTRGANPAVVHLVRDTIRDGDLRVQATKQGRHEALWVVAGGYLLRDYNVGKRRLTRVVFVGTGGERRELARSRSWIDVEVSPAGTHVAIRESLGETTLRSRVTVTDPVTGQVFAQRELRHVTLVAVTANRALLARRLFWRDPATVWWNYDRDRLRRIHGQAALDADLQHDKVVFSTSSVGEFCNRVAMLSQPKRTLWRSCGVDPHQWSPDGTHAIATHTYFDAAGTDRWWVIDGETAERQARITGRLDWDAVWEDDQHFLTLAQSDAGRAAILRCDLAGACERASRLWDVPVPSEPSLYYDSPPVVLADR